ncbi:MAG: ATP-binding protein [Minwuia sp.]|uniref:ATP-binding protein n=1 Tax=Minwuia sp. TaxID=2493630 RepID=UPI003A8A7CD5
MARNIADHDTEITFAMFVTLYDSNGDQRSSFENGCYTSAMTGRHSASFKCSADQVQPAALWVEETSSALGLPEKDSLRLALVAEEMFANSLHHANLTPGGEVNISLSREGDEVRLDYREPGAAFNPLSVEVAEAPELDRWPIGGLGLRLIHNVSSRADYEREGDFNRLSIWMEAPLNAA